MLTEGDIIMMLVTFVKCRCLTINYAVINIYGIQPPSPTSMSLFYQFVTISGFPNEIKKVISLFQTRGSSDGEIPDGKDRVYVTS